MSIELQSVKEGKTAVVQCTVQNELHEAIPGSGLETLTLKLYDKETLTVLNSRDRVDILGLSPVRVNGATINEQGLLDLRLDPADTAIVDEELAQEIHVLLVEWTWFDTGVRKYGGEELELPIDNMRFVGTV